MQIFYANDADIQQGKLNEEESAHCLRVLRKSIGDTIIVTNGLGLIIYATIHQADKKNFASFKNHRGRLVLCRPHGREPSRGFP